MDRSRGQRRPSLIAVPLQDRLNGWKEIGAYLCASVRTAQRWEAKECLPVHRHQHAAMGTVYASRREIDAWLERSRERTVNGGPYTPPATITGIPPIRRLLVLPFRLLRADPEIEFLCLGLADAITASLTSVESLVLRSPLMAARYSRRTDPQRIAQAAGVHLVVVGTLLRAGGLIRASTQLVEGANGTVVCSQTFDGCLHDIFRLQDEIVSHVVASLALPLSMRERELLRRDIPANTAAYEHYVRANELAPDYHQILAARDLYAHSVEEDPKYAPAWARLGRCCRVIAKFGGEPQEFARAEVALRRALELNPDLTFAQNQLAYLEADCGRAESAMVRLLQRAEFVRTDPELFAGLVHVCRFCGLLEASVAAHEIARRLDPHVRTSVCHTHFMRGHYDLALETSHEIRDFVGPLALAAMGRREEAITLARERQSPYPLPLSEYMISSVGLIVEGNESALDMCERAIGLISKGPEELFYQARNLAHLGETGRALAILARAIDEGFFCYPALACDPWLERLRAASGFAEASQRAQERHARAVRAFRAAGGERLIGLAAAPGQASNSPLDFLLE